MSWRQLQFKDFVTLQRGFDLPKLRMVEGDVPVLGSHCVIGYHNEVKVEAPGVVTGRSGTLGRVQYTESPFWPHNTALWVKDFKGNNPKFVYYKLLTLELERFNGGASVPTLNRNVLDTLLINAPSKAEQARIISILSIYDDLIENNQRRIALLEEAARLLYREWFVYFRFPGHKHFKIINGHPEGWKRTVPNEIIANHIGGGWGKDEPQGKEGEPAFVIRGTDIPRVESGDISSVGLRFHNAASLSSRVLLPYDVVFEVSGGSSSQPIARTLLLTQERLKLWNTNVICASFCKRFTFNRAAEALYFIFHIREHRDRGDVLVYQKESASSLKNFNFDAFMSSYEFLIPPDSLRKLFFESIDPIVRLQSVLAAQIQHLAKTRDLLLPRLMSGEIAV